MPRIIIQKYNNYNKHDALAFYKDIIVDSFKCCLIYHHHHRHHHEYTILNADHVGHFGPGEHWFQGKLEFMLSQRGKPLLVHDGHTFGIQYVRKDKKYWQCNLSRKFNCKARVTTTDTGEIIVTNNEHCHTEIRQHLRKDYQRNKVMMNALINLSTNRLAVDNLRRHNMNSIANNLTNLQTMVAAATSSSPLALHSHVDSKAAAMNAAMAGTLLDLGKRSVSMEEQQQDYKFSNHHHFQHPTQELFLKHHEQQSLQVQNQNLTDIKADDDDDDDESIQDEQPLDCGIRSSMGRYEAHDPGKSLRQQDFMEGYNNTAAQAAAAAVHQLQSTTTSITSNNNNCNDNSEWQTKNETIQQ